MSGEALYERYKDALRRGHVASLRGRLEEALTAYAEAATIAPERATPHTSAASALMRRKRPADALRHYGTALTLAPRDEAALLGRAQALVALDRRPEAADAFDALAEVRASAGKLADAVDAARRGLEMAEGRERRRTLEQLLERLRASEPGAPGRATLEQALRVLEGTAVAEQLQAVAPVMPADAAAATEPPAGVAAEELPPGVAAEEQPAAPHADDAGPAPADAEPAAVETPERTRSALDRDLPDDLDVVALAALVDDGLDNGAPDTLDRVLDLAAAYRRDGRLDAALDACYRALSIDPDAVGLHLAIVELYDERGWSTLAVEKLDLLGRLAELDGDAAASGLVAAARAGRG